MRDMKPMNASADDPFAGGSGKEVEFDPTKLNIDQALFQSFQSMMQEKADDPNMMKAF